MNLEQRLARLERATRLSNSSIGDDFQIELLQRLEQQAWRITASGLEPGPVDRMSQAERIERGALEVGEVGSSAFRAELLRLLCEFAERWRQEERIAPVREAA